MHPLTAAVLALFIGAGLVLVWQTALRDQRRSMRWRAGLLDDCRALLDAPEISIGPDRHPILRGRYGNDPVRISVFTDTLVTRRLPQLWCEVAIERPISIGTTIGVLVRPTGAEYYARTHELALRLDVPPSWPGNAVVRAGRMMTADALLAIEDALAPMLADPRVKEIIVGPAGTSIIWQAAEGDRGAHLILRQSVFALDRLPADDVAARIEALAHLQLASRTRDSAAMSAGQAA